MAASDIAGDVTKTLAWLERRGTRKNRDAMARFGIVAPRAYGVSMATMETLAKRLRPNHELALALWDSGWHEARLLASMIDDPACVTSAQMEQWCREFENWAVCDTACFKLFDRSPLAWKKIGPWSRRRAEFEKRTAFALLASLALHDQAATDQAFLRTFPLIDEASDDPRNFVKKGVSWALRGIGHRNVRLHGGAVALATRMTASDDPTRRWVGKDVLRDLTRPAVVRRLETRRQARPAPR